jgi:hypothetical protein
MGSPGLVEGHTTPALPPWEPAAAEGGTPGMFWTQTSLCGTWELAFCPGRTGVLRATSASPRTEPWGVRLDYRQWPVLPVEDTVPF